VGPVGALFHPMAATFWSLPPTSPWKPSKVSALQAFRSNATSKNCNIENLVARDRCITTILKMVAIHAFNTTVFKMLQSSVAFGGRYCNGEKWL